MMYIIPQSRPESAPVDESASEIYEDQTKVKGTQRPDLPEIEERQGTNVGKREVAEVAYGHAAPCDLRRPSWPVARGFSGA